MKTQNKNRSLYKRTMLVLTPVIAVLLVGWGVKTSGYSFAGLYKDFAGEVHTVGAETMNRPTIQGMIDSLVITTDSLEKAGELQRSIDSLSKAVSLKYNQARLEMRLEKMIEKKKELQNEYYAELPSLPLNEGCTGKRMTLIKKIYKLDPKSISANLKKELDDCK